MKINYNNMGPGRSKAVFTIRYILNGIRTWIIFHVLYKGRIKYDGMVRVSRGTQFLLKDIKIGNNVQFGTECRIMNPAVFHNNILLASKVNFVGRYDHVTNIPGQLIWDGRPGYNDPIIVEGDVWIGYGATIMAGVTIGKGSVIAVGSVVTKNVPPCEVWGGVPAKKIHDRFKSEEEKAFHLKYLSTI